jgi:hypothetical protein
VSSNPSPFIVVLVGLMITPSFTLLLLALIFSWNVRRHRQGTRGGLSPPAVVLPLHSADDMTEISSKRNSIAGTSESIAGSLTNSRPTSSSDAVTDVVASLIFQRPELDNESATILPTRQPRIPDVTADELRGMIREEITRAMSGTRLPSGVVSRNTSTTSSPPPSYHTRRSWF